MYPSAGASVWPLVVIAGLIILLLVGIVGLWRQGRKK